MPEENNGSTENNSNEANKKTINDNNTALL